MSAAIRRECVPLRRTAVEYECFRLLSRGRGVVMGDLLPCSGMADQSTRDLLESVRGRVELKEPWCRGARPVVDIAVLRPDEFQESDETSAGVARLLEESSHQFDVIDTRMDFTPYKVLVLPDYIRVSDELNGKLEAYLAQGGKLIASFESGMNTEKTGFPLHALGVECVRPGPIARDGKPARGREFDHTGFVDCIIPRSAISQGLVETAHPMHTRCAEVKALPGSEVLADVMLPEFDPSCKRFCSYREPHSSRTAGSAGIVRNGNAIYFAHNVFQLYSEYAAPWIKKLFVNALSILLPEQLIRHDGPSTMIATVTEQSDQNRWVIHLLHYILLGRTAELDVLDDVIPLHEVKVSLKVPKEVSEIQLRPQHHDPVEFWPVGERIEFVVPRISGHQMVEVSFR